MHTHTHTHTQTHHIVCERLKQNGRWQNFISQRAAGHDQTGSDVLSVTLSPLLLVSETESWVTHTPPCPAQTHTHTHTHTHPNTHHHHPPAPNTHMVWCGVVWCGEVEVEVVVVVVGVVVVGGDALVVRGHTR